MSVQHVYVLLHFFNDLKTKIMLLFVAFGNLGQHSLYALGSINRKSLAQI